jgi:hypothetical protein
VKIIDVKVNEVELLRLTENPFYHQSMMCQRIDAFWIEPERFFACGNQSRVGYRVAAGKQGYVVSERDQLFRQP